MKKSFQKINIFFMLVFLFFSISACAVEDKVCFKGECFDVEVASKPDEMARGLMFRDSLDYDKGMLFVFQDLSEHNFWMKNTLIPLDIIWVGEDNKVVFIKENAQPCKGEFCQLLSPGKKAKYAFEVNAGICARIGLDVGDTLDIKIRGSN